MTPSINDAPMRLRPLLLLLAVAVLSAACTTSERTVMPTMQSSALTSVNVEDYENRYPEQPAVFLTIDETAEHVATKSNLDAADTEWILYQTIQRRYVVLDPDDDVFNQFKLRADRDDIELLSLRLQRPDGTTERFGIDDLTETSDGGETLLKLPYPNVTKGTVIEEVFDTKEFYPGPYFTAGLQSNVPIEDLTFTFAYPNWWNVRLKDLGETRELDVETRSVPAKKKTYIEYTATDLPGIADEPFSPFQKEVADYFEVMVTDADFGQGGMLDLPSTWESLGAELYDTYIDQRRSLRNTFQKKTQELLVGVSTDQEKVDRFLGYVSSDLKRANNRDVTDFDDLIRAGGGSPYLINGMLAAMLDMSGMEAQVVMVHTANSGYFDPMYVSPTQISVPGVRVQIDGSYKYLFPFLEDLPVGLIPKPLQGERMLILTMDETSYLERVPEQTTADLSTRERYDVEITEDGIVNVKETRTLRGVDAYSFRKRVEDLTDEERVDLLKESVTYEDGELDWSVHEIANPDAFGEPLNVELAYSIGNLVTLTPEEVIVQTSGLFSALTGEKVVVDPSERQNPVSIKYPQAHQQVIALSYPTGWSLQTEVEETSVENEFGRVKTTVTPESGSLTATSDLELNAIERPKEEFVDLLTLIGGNSRLTIPTLIFSTEPAADAAGEASDADPAEGDAR